LLTPQIIDAQNHRAFSSPFAVKAYTAVDGLTPGEVTILETLRSRITDKAILDIGVGAGRTTPSLLEISRDYTAIDYSEVLVHQARKRFGLDSIYCCDVRDMSRFPDRGFDFVYFSFNGLDCISHEGRLRALGEIRRVLKPQGIFLFSSHNRAHLEDPPGATRQYTRIESIKRAVWKMLLLPRHFRLRRHETATSEYAIVNDSGLRYSLLLYYITISSQVAQLEKLEFSVQHVYDMQGTPVGYDDRSPWIYYLVTTP
jgi:ubiquinone/menaquinone biosynthesis C-methylase UbiE